MNVKLLALFSVVSIFSQFLGNSDISNDTFIFSQVLLLGGTLLGIKFLQKYSWRELISFLLASFSHPIMFAVALWCAFPLKFHIETNVDQLNLSLFWSIMMLGTYFRFMVVEWFVKRREPFYVKSVLWNDFLSHHKILTPFLILTFVFMFPVEGNVVGFIYFPAGLLFTMILYPIYFLLSLTLYFPRLKEKLQWLIKIQGVLGLLLFLLIGGFIFWNNFN
jgi:hypothetical protein